MKNTIRLIIFSAFILIQSAFSQQAVTTNDSIKKVHTPKPVNAVHDPVMIKEGDTYYVFGTGQGISVKSSKDKRTGKILKPFFRILPVCQRGIATIFPLNVVIFGHRIFTTATGCFIFIILFQPGWISIRALDTLPIRRWIRIHPSING